MNAEKVEAAVGISCASCWRRVPSDPSIQFCPYCGFDLSRAPSWKATLFWMLLPFLMLGLHALWHVLVPLR